MSDDKFTCQQCGETFEKAWSDEDAQAEWKSNFPEEHAADSDQAIVCDDCYEKIRAAFYREFGDPS